MALEIAFSLKLPYPSIITIYLFKLKLFSKNTSICPFENIFLSFYSKAWCYIWSDGNNKSFINYDFPDY